MESNRHRSFLIGRTWVMICGALIMTSLLVLLVSDLYPTRQVEKGASLETFAEHLSDRIPGFMNAYEIPGVCIALLKGGETVWTKAYGYADLESGRMMTTDTCLRVQSISKSVTAWGVMKLVEQGEIDLDKPVAPYLKNWAFPPSPFASGKMTVRQLLCHCAGLPLGDFLNRYSPKEDRPSLEESLSKEAQLMQEPGRSFAYSNTGFNVLELLVESVTGRDFAEYMAQEILFPLGMHHSSFTWREQLDPPVPTGYDLSGRAVPAYVYPEKGSGGLFATVDDISAFVAAGMPGLSQDHPILSDKSIRMLHTPMVEVLGMYRLAFDAYGLGHYIERFPNGQKAVSHGGQGTGWMTHFHSVPETGDGIVILTNSQRSWPFIAYVLSDWAHWSGLSPVGMEQILFGHQVLWLFISLIWFASILQLWRLAAGLIQKRRHFAPLSKESRFLRSVQISSFAGIGAGLLWCVSQPYLDISSIFPIASRWLGASLLAFAFALFLSASVPLKSKHSIQKESGE